LGIKDLFSTDINGKGITNILDSQELFKSSQIYSSLLLWLLSELYEELPEVGDLKKPKIVFFDEAYLLFKDTPKILLEKIELIVRLIRSKSVGIYFVTQNPTDIPDSVPGQLGNRVQHALRAYTPRDEKSVKLAAETFKANPAFDTAEVLSARSR
jgi:DNA helicase HerA-like ATPase